MAHTERMGCVGLAALAGLKPRVCSTFDTHLPEDVSVSNEPSSEPPSEVCAQCPGKVLGSNKLLAS